MAKDTNRDTEKEAASTSAPKSDSKTRFAVSYLLRKYKMKPVQAPYLEKINSITEEDFLSKKKKFEGGK